MFFAQMYCYGSDLNAVGITGIRGCMGVVYACAGRMYAIHIPPSSDQTNALAASAFAQCVTNHGDGGAADGDLFFFLAGTTRPTAISEARHITSLIGPGTATVFRIMKGLGEGSGGDHAELSPSILVARGLPPQYKCLANDDYVGGDFNAEGQYLGSPGGMDSSKVPRDCVEGWTPMTGENCYRVSIR